MTELPKPEVIFTHESDLDGYIAGALLQRLAKKMHAEVLVAQMKKGRIIQSGTKNFDRFYYLNNRNH